jgi:predicted Holliday junction resolvase-like endonuclease
METEVLNVVIDQEKVEALQKTVEAKEAELAKKVYVVEMNESLLQTYAEVMETIQWKGKEALGIVEIFKKIDAIKEKGISNNVAFLGALEIEASHYFFNRFETSGSEVAERFIKLFTAFETALGNISADNKELTSLKQDLAVAQQGLEAE